MSGEVTVVFTIGQMRHLHLFVGHHVVERCVVIQVCTFLANTLLWISVLTLDIVEKCNAVIREHCEIVGMLISIASLCI